MCSFFLSVRMKAGVSHFDPNFITVQQQQELWANVPAAQELFKMVSECNLQEEKKEKSCNESSSGVFCFFFSSPHPVFQEVQSKAGSLHNMQSTHARMPRGCTGCEQVGERALDGQSLSVFIWYSQLSAHRGTVLLQPVHLVMNNAHTFRVCRWMSRFGTFLRAAVGFCYHSLMLFGAEKVTDTDRVLRQTRLGQWSRFHWINSYSWLFVARQTKVTFSRNKQHLSSITLEAKISLKFNN